MNTHENTTVYRLSILFISMWEMFRFSGQERLSTALWFISGAEICIRLDKDLKFCRWRLTHLGFSRFFTWTSLRFLEFGFSTVHAHSPGLAVILKKGPLKCLVSNCMVTDKSSRKSHVFVHLYIASKIFGNMTRKAAQNILFEMAEVTRLG